MTASTMNWPAESNMAKELKKWDLPKRQGGYNADGYEEYPRMLYKAQPDPTTNSKTLVVRLLEDVYHANGRDIRLYADQFNARCQMIVKSDHELDQAYKAGWRKSEKEAMEYVRGLENAVAEAAAFRNYEDRNKSELAKREIEAAEASTHKNFGEIPEAPRVKRKYTRKVKPEAGV